VHNNQVIPYKASKTFLKIARLILVSTNAGTAFHFWHYRYYELDSFWLKMPHIGNLFIILSFIEINQLNLVELCRSRARINPVNFIRIAQGIRSLGVIILVKFQICTEKRRGGRKMKENDKLEERKWFGENETANFQSLGGRKSTSLSRSR